jgi:hypothetical protein
MGEDVAVEGFKWDLVGHCDFKIMIHLSGKLVGGGDNINDSRIR